MKPPLSIGRTITFLVSSLALFPKHLKITIFTFALAAFTQSAMGDVINLAVDKADGTTNLWPDQPLNYTPLYNGTTQSLGVGAELDNAGVFLAGATGAGSGVYRTLFRLQANGNEQGYNRVTSGGEFNETSLGPSATPNIRISDLVKTSDGNYYIFSFDANQAGQAPKLLSLDSLRIYTANDTDGNLATFDEHIVGGLPNTFAGLGALGDLRYDMDSITDNTIVLEAGGSGASDMFFFVPVANFAGDSLTDQVYFYADHGKYAPVGSTYSFTSNSGFEEWSLPQSTTTRPDISPIPEPSTFLLLILGIGAVMVRRKRN